LNNFDEKFNKVGNRLFHIAAVEGMGGGIQPAVPEHMEAFDLFIRNDGTKEDLFKVIDEQLVPFVQSYVFEFPSENVEQKCLISY